MPECCTLSKAHATAVATLAVLCTGAACEAPADAVELAATYVVHDMLFVIPPGIEGEPSFYVAESWEGTPPGEPIPPAVLEAASLMPLVHGQRPPPDATAVVLDLFKPRTSSGDTIEVHAEWLVVVPGATTFWGHSYDYVMVCKRRCRLLRRSGAGILN